MEEQSILNKWIRIQSFKHDGSLHRTWENVLALECNEDYIVTASRRSQVIEADGRMWNTKEPAISVFFFKEWFNVIAMMKKDDICYYCNIASPSLIDKMTIKYIDYDLDLKLLTNEEILSLDEREYEYHKVKYGYSDDIDKICLHAFEKVKKMMEDKIFPFDKNRIRKYEEEFEKEHQYYESHYFW